MGKCAPHVPADSRPSSSSWPVDYDHKLDSVRDLASGEVPEGWLETGVLELRAVDDEHRAVGRLARIVECDDRSRRRQILWLQAIAVQDDDVGRFQPLNRLGRLEYLHVRLHTTFAQGGGQPRCPADVAQAGLGTTVGEDENPHTASASGSTNSAPSRIRSQTKSR